MFFRCFGSLSRTALVVTSLLCFSLSAEAVPQKPDPTLPNQIQAAITPLLEKARESVSDAFTRVKRVDSPEHAREMLALERAIAEKMQSTSKDYDKALGDYAKALDELEGAEVTASVIEAIVELHTTLKGQVQSFRDQALNSSSSSFMSGDANLSRNPAMSEILFSEEAYLKQASEVIRGATSWNKRFESELLALSRGWDDRSLPFGFEHHLSLLLQRVDAQRTMLTRASPFFAGVAPDGSTVTPTLDCSENDSRSFRSFQGDLGVVTSWGTAPRVYSSTDPAVVSWVRLMNESALVAYNGDSSGSTPGYIRTWEGCITSKDNNIAALTNEIDRELNAGNRELAQEFDKQREALRSQKTVLSAQAAIVRHRALQLSAVMRSVSDQATTQNLATYPDAWRKTINAHAKDLNDVASAFPPLFQAVIGLLDRIEADLNTLKTMKNEEEIKTRLRLIAATIAVAQSSGFERLLSQLDSAQESLDVMASGIAGGGTLLSEALDTFRTTTETKLTFLTRERNDLPAKLQAAQDTKATTMAAFNRASAAMTHAAANKETYIKKRTELRDAVRLYYAKFGGARNNPIYTALGNELMKRAVTAKPVAKQKTVVEQYLMRTLAFFPGIDTTGQANQCPQGQKHCKKQRVKIKNAAAKALARIQKSMMQEVVPLISTVSRKIAGKSLSDLVTTIENDYRDIMALKTS